MIKSLLMSTSVFGLTAVMINPYPVVRWTKTRIPPVARTGRAA